MKNSEKLLLSAGAALVGALYLKNRQTRLPKGAKPIKKFDILKYLGKWYEIARLDFRHEKNMSNVTANYSVDDDGTIKVLNIGYNTRSKKWKSAEGEIRFVGKKSRARLKVSFQKPFWAGYNVIAIDDDYKYALVVGNSTKYVWILSREKTIPDEIREEYLLQAIRLGYDPRDIYWTEHDID